MNIFRRLKQEHDYQRNLCDQLLNKCLDRQARQRLFSKFRSEVEAHAEAEEQTFYAALIETQQGQGEVRYSVVEHERCIVILDRLCNFGISHGEWLIKFEQLWEDWESHLSEEETDVFSCARLVLSQRQINHLTDIFDDRKSVEKNRFTPEHVQSLNLHY